MEKEYILHKWLNDSATSEELEYLKTSPEYNTLIKIAVISSGLEAPESNSEANFKTITSNLINNKREVKKLIPFASLLKVAAVLALLLVGYLYISSLDTEVQTQIAEKQNILLPDNSEVIINANSAISYNKKKWSQQRELKLTGEAYFKVTKGNTFSVKTSLGIVTVLGTQFNVYSRDNLFNIECYEGLVSVAFNDTLIKLPAGSRLSIENGVLVKHDISILSFPNWTINESSFENALLSTVLQELKRQYPIKLITKFNDVNQRYTGSFSHNDLNLALKSICDPLHLAYTIEEESITIYDKESP